MDKFQSGKYKFSSVKPLFLIGNYVIGERGKEINILVDELIKYKVLIKDLISREVSYSQRNELVTISMYIAANFELYDSFINNIEIPFSKLHMFTRVNKKFLEKYRDYIIVYTLIFGNDKYKNIQDYLQMVETSVDDSKNSDVKDIVEYEAGLTVNGIVVWKNKKDAILLTALGEFKKVKLNEDVLIGQEINANEKKTLKDVKIYISILVVFILVFSMAIIYRYNVVTRTIVIDTSSTIKLDINGFNRVLNISSSTEKGAKLIEETNLLDQSIDTAIYKIIEYANENQMIKSTGIVVTVTGKELKHNSLEKTEDFIYRKNLKVRFNNSGLEHKVN